MLVNKLSFVCIREIVSLLADRDRQLRYAHVEYA